MFADLVLALLYPALNLATGVVSLVALVAVVLVVALTTPWLTATESAERARVGVKVIYSEIRSGRLKAARVGGRRAFRLLPAWIDSWLEETATPVEVSTFRRRA